MNTLYRLVKRVVLPLIAAVFFGRAVVARWHDPIGDLVIIDATIACVSGAMVLGWLYHQVAWWWAAWRDRDRVKIYDPDPWS